MGFAALSFSLATPAFAQATLRITTSTIGPISITTGAAGPTQTIEAYNAGTGTLALSFSSNATWLSAAAGATRTCQIAVQQASCIPITVTLSTTTLARGTYTGTITVRDPNAIDAPQTITVTAQVGGGIPDTVFLYSAPNGGSDSVAFAANSALITNATTQSGGPWLTVAYEGRGSFNFVQPYKISAQQLSGMAEGTYNGTVQIAGSNFAADNKTVQTRFVVTSQPIAFAGPERVSVKIAQNSAASTVNIGIGNRGLGTVAVTGVTTTLTNGAGWLAAAPATGFTGVAVTLTPGTLTPGTYRGLVNIAVNAINGPVIAVPVDLEVVATATPTVAYGGVLNNANFLAGDTLGAGTITALFGEFLTDAVYSAPGAPLPTTLGGVRVLVNGTAAPLYFASPGQVNFQVPLEASAGTATVQIERNGVVGNRVSATLGASAGRILIWPGLRYGIIVNADGTLPLPTNVQLGTYTSKPVMAGETLVIYAIGFGQTNPAVASGAASPSSPLAALSGVVVRFGVPGLFDSSIAQPAAFAGLTPGFVGLYQINVTIPAGLPPQDDLDVTIEYQNQPSNRAKIATR